MMTAAALRARIARLDELARGLEREVNHWLHARPFVESDYLREYTAAIHEAVLAVDRAKRVLERREAT